MDERARLREFLGRARRRSVVAVCLRQAVVAAGVGFAGIILLLFLGTQILDWYWIALICAGSFLFGLVRTLREVPSPYLLAQRVDQRVGLDDCLSTAFYFSDPQSSGRGSKEFRESLLQHAARLCSEITVKAASPIRPPRKAYFTAVLAVAAISMFTLRYAVRGSLDLRPPLAPSIIDYFRPSWLIAASRDAAARRLPKLPPTTAFALDSQKQYPEEAAAPDKNVKAPAGASKTNREKSDASEVDSGMLDKMKNAFLDMLEKLGIEPVAGEETASGPTEGKEEGKESKDGSGKGDLAKDKGDKQATSSTEQVGEDAGPGDQKALSQQAAGGERKNGEDTEGEGEGSGIGESEGEKAIQEAAELAAMGKISEILGKRQENLTGEIMVEVSATKQQKLTTPYSDSSAGHSEGGGEIHRDEVPLAYQQYVQQYFEQVRKPTPPATPPAKP